MITTAGSRGCELSASATDNVVPSALVAVVISAAAPPASGGSARSSGSGGGFESSAWHMSLGVAARGRIVRMHVVALGFGLGFVVAAAIGPISLLCIRTVLRGALPAGIAIGAGAAVIDATYALLGALGAGRLLTIGPLQIVLGLGGAAVIAWLGIRTLWSAFRVRLGGEALEEVALAGARVPDVAGGDRVEPVDDPVVGGGVRGGVDGERRRRHRRRRCCCAWASAAGR